MIYLILPIWKGWGAMSESYYNSVLMPLDRIRSAMTGMSKTHKKIAEYLLSNYESAAFLTSIVLARNCGVSESSVIRFSMMLGYSGLQRCNRDFRM